MIKRTVPESWDYEGKVDATTGPLITCIDTTGRSPVLTGELVHVDWHGLPVQVTNGLDRSSEFLIAQYLLFSSTHTLMLSPLSLHVQCSGPQV